MNIATEPQSGEEGLSNWSSPSCLPTTAIGRIICPTCGYIQNHTEKSFMSHWATPWNN